MLRLCCCGPGEDTTGTATQEYREEKDSTKAHGEAGDQKQREGKPLEVSMSEAKIAILYYSMYGHVDTLAREEKKGMESIDGIEAKLMRVPETLPNDVLQKMGAPDKPSDVPEAKPEDLEGFDGVLIGAPTRFGNVAAQMKAFWDATGKQWQSGKYFGKPAGVFFSTATQGGGQETTAQTFINNLVHHGFVFVPTGYCSPNCQFQLDEIIGGSAWGAGTFAGPDGSRQPSEKELQRARDQVRPRKFCSLLSSSPHRRVLNQTVPILSWHRALSSQGQPKL